MKARGARRNPVDQTMHGIDRMVRNVETGPPVLAPLLVTMVAGMGPLAAILRREK